MTKRAVVLLNLGTPDDATPAAVGRYLGEFLMDEAVIDIPAPLRWFFVNALIVPKRKHSSAQAYQKIWGQDSPLRRYHLALGQQVQAHLGHDTPLITAMRYGSPSLDQAALALKKIAPQEILFLPLYPQWSNAANGSSVTALKKVLKKHRIDAPVHTLNPFFNEPEWVDLVARKCLSTIQRIQADHLLLSFHGLPKRQILKSNPSVCYSAGCCDSPGSRPWCYRRHCVQSAQAIGKKISIPWSMSFQSRLGRTEWIKPYTDEVISELIRSGVKNLAVACPAFTTDCLETLEEVAIRLKENFISLGGKNLELVPCLNDDPDWAALLAKWIQQDKNYFSQQ